MLTRKNEENKEVGVTITIKKINFMIISKITVS